MSDVLQAMEKAEEGAEWRGNIRADIDGEVHDLTIRQLFDPEARKVESLIDTTVLREIREAIPDDVKDEYEDLQEKDDLDDDEEDRLRELTQQMNEAKEEVGTPDGFFKAVRFAARKALVPDEDDVHEALADPEFVRYVEDEYDVGRVNEPEDLYDPDKEGPVEGHPGPLKDHIQKTLIDRATDGASYQIGMKVLEESLEEEGN